MFISIERHYYIPYTLFCFRLSLAIPLDREGYSRCSMYDVNYTLILLNESYVPNPLWPTKTCQHGWEFNYSDVPYATVATEVRQEIFNLQVPLFDCFFFLLF